MRLCRFKQSGKIAVGFYTESAVISLSEAAKAAKISLPGGDSLLPYLPGGSAREAVLSLQTRLENLDDAGRAELSIPTDSVKLLVPVPSPTKLMLLAGNYSAHIEEGGGRAEERANTFPYVFMKPPLK